MAESMADGCTFVQHYLQGGGKLSLGRDDLMIVSFNGTCAVALRQLACLGAALLKVVPQLLQRIELAGGVGEESVILGRSHVADE